MLKDRRHIQIIARARQPNVQDPSRSRVHFDRIFHDFLGATTFAGATLMDLGPGQYDFGELARERGATVHGVDKDPAVVALGREKEFPVRLGDLRRLRVDEVGLRFDGVFCKFSINAFWFWDDEEAHIAHIREIGRLLRPRGWAWLAPWNGIPKRATLAADVVRRTLAVQAQTLASLGFKGFNLTEALSQWYGVHGITANRALYVINLPVPSAVAECERLRADT